MIDGHKLKNIIEGALLAAGRPLTIDNMLALFSDEERPERTAIREALETLQTDFASRGIELKEVASGWRVQVRAELAPWISRLWEERPTRYSRALLETLALIAYRQPITRAEIEDIRGVSVSTSIMKTLQDREWVRIVGYRDVPGRPAMYGTTRQFLDYFGLKSLDELPTLAELRDIDSINVELDFEGAAKEYAEMTRENHDDDAAGASDEPDNRKAGEENDGKVVRLETAAEPGHAAREEEQARV